MLGLWLRRERERENYKEKRRKANRDANMSRHAKSRIRAFGPKYACGAKLFVKTTVHLYMYWAH